MSTHPQLDALDASPLPYAESDLVAAIDAALGPPAATAAGRLYVPDAEGASTPQSRDADVIGPAVLLEPESRSLSSRCSALAVRTVALANEVRSAQAGVQALLTQAGAKMASLRSYLSAPSGGWMRSSDRFLDLSRLDPALTHGVDVQTSTHSGVGLAPASEQDLSARSTLSVRGDLGIPGDNTEVTSVQDTPSALSPAASQSALSLADKAAAAGGGQGQEPTVTFATGSDAHNDPASVLSDRDDLFFDWERVWVPTTQRCSLHGTAYVSDPQRGTSVDVRSVTKDYGWTASLNGKTVPLVSWGPVSESLAVEFRMDLGAAQPMNELVISVRQVGGLWPTVTSVTVSADGSQWYSLRGPGGATTWTGPAPASPGGSGVIGAGGVSTSPATGLSVVGGSVWNVPPLPDVPTVRYVSVALSQPAGYPCPKGIGHPYYVEVTEEKKSSTSWFGLSHSHSDNTTVKRLPSPDQIVGVSPGVISSSSSQGSKLLTTVGTIAASIPGGQLYGLGAQVLGAFWGNSSDVKSVLQAGEYVDVFQASRQCVSVRSIKAYARSYPSAPGQAVSEPITFSQPFSSVRLLVDDSVPAGTSIAYDVSFDRGGTWLPITATDLGLPAPAVRPPGSVVTADSPQTTALVRGTLSTTDPLRTPRWLGYCLEALPALV